MTSLRTAHGANTRESAVQSQATSRVVIALFIAVLVLGAAFASSQRPLIIAGLVVGTIVAAFVISRSFAAVALLAASFYFDAYLTGGAGVLTVGKLIGAIAVLGWLFEWTMGRRSVVTDPSLWIIAAFGVWMLPSIAIARDGSQAVLVASRYVNFFALYFLLIQAVAGDRRRAVLLVKIVVAAAAISAVIGLENFLSGGVDRARGPLGDSNDFGFVMVTTLPLALYCARRCVTTFGRTASIAASVFIFAAVVATLSRGAFVSLAVMVAWAIVTRRIKLRWLFAGFVAVAALGLFVSTFYKPVVDNALGHKTHIAATNQTSRLIFWRVAYREFKTSPILGVGPGNYQVRYTEFELPFDLSRSGASHTTGVTTTHNAYLNILAELGLPGFGLYIAFLVLAWSRLRRRCPRDSAADNFQFALAAGFLMAVVGSMFLTEQFYSPIWFLSAVGATLATSGRAAPPSQRHPTRRTWLFRP